MIGETATASDRRASTAARTPGTASTGSIDTIGFEGATTTRSASPMAARTPGAGRAASAPSKRTAVTATSWWRSTKYSWNPISPSPATVTRVCSRSSVTGRSRRPRSQAAAISALTSDSVAPARRRSVR